MDRGAWRATVYGITKPDTTELLDTFTGKLSEKTSRDPCIPVLPRSGDSVPSPTGHPLPLASRSRGRSGGGQALSDLPGGTKGPTKVRQIPWHMSDTGRAQQGSCPHSNGASSVFWSLTVTPRVVLDQGIDSGDSRPRAGVGVPLSSPPTTLPLRSTPTQPAGKRGHSRQPVCFYIQFIHSSIQYTETFIYRYIYRISYINLFLLFTAVLVWIFHTLGTKKVMGGWHEQCMSVCGAQLSLLIAYGGRPGPWEDGPVPSGRPCAAGLGDRVGGLSEPSWAEGGGSDPPECGAWRKGDTRSRPILQGRGGEGVG